MNPESSSPGVRRRPVNELTRVYSDSQVPSFKKIHDSECSSSNDDVDSSANERDAELSESSPETSIPLPRQGVHERSRSPSHRQSVANEPSKDDVDFTSNIKFSKKQFPSKGTASATSKAKTSPKKNEKVSSLPVIGFLFAIFFVVFIFYLFTDVSDDENELDIAFNIAKISRKYPVANELVWDYLQSGIERLVNEEKEPAVFFLVQWSAESVTAYNIALAVGNITAKNISISSFAKNPVIFSPSILNSYERGDIIDLYQEDLRESHVMIVKDIEKVIPEIAQDFRYYCDEENPLVGKLVIFFIMNMKECENISKTDLYEGPIKDIVSVIEACLVKIWGGQTGLDDSILYPVLARIVNVVLPIQDINDN